MRFVEWPVQEGCVKRELKTELKSFHIYFYSWGQVFIHFHWTFRGLWSPHFSNKYQVSYHFGKPKQKQSSWLTSKAHWGRQQPPKALKVFLYNFLLKINSLYHPVSFRKAFNKNKHSEVLVSCSVERFKESKRFRKVPFLNIPWIFPEFFLNLS